MSPLAHRIAGLYRKGLAMAPPEMWLDPRIAGMTEFKPAAVLVAITDRAEPGVLLIHRPETMRAHPGQIAFPGGRHDPGEGPVAAALREADEELGIDPGAVTVIGASDRYRSGSGYEITPVLAVIPADTGITPNPDEVADWFEAPLAHLLDPTNHAVRHIDWDGTSHPFIEILWQQHRIWGVTAAIISNLSKRLGGGHG